MFLGGGRHAEKRAFARTDPEQDETGRGLGSQRQEGRAICWENGYAESFNGKFRDELLNREIIYTLKEARILIEMWRREYNTIRPHSALGYRPPTSATFMPAVQQRQD